MTLSPLAGKPAPKELLVDLARLEREYFERRPNLDDPEQLVSFGTSGHRGSSLRGTFTEAHILAITQAILAIFARRHGITGPLFMGKDTHALSGAGPAAPLSKFWPPMESIRSSSTATDLRLRRSSRTPSWSLTAGANEISPTASSLRPRTIRRRTAASNTIPPMEVPPIPMSPAGFIIALTTLLRSGNPEVKRLAFAAAVRPPLRMQQDFVLPYVDDLRQRRRYGGHSRRRPEASASIRWAALPCPTGSRSANVYGLNITVVNPKVDPTFSFMTVDHDGKIRMDCSSPYAMASLVGLKDGYRRRLRERSRLRSAWHCHAARRG